ncbi:MAG: Asp-tRNA(Asn)/Glu-tRNA(Gln) amidotransferase subunit GatB [Mycoplasmoidaceae bacterium]
MNNYEIRVGIEIHAVVNTLTKMFSPSKNSHNSEPNTCINEIDLGHPGILPSPNKEVVKKAIILAHALHMEIENYLQFDRKNYYYQDLPKGYQITQFFKPIGKNGYIKIDNNKIINIERIQIEEDTAKQTLKDSEIHLDYNRSGLPLLEIISKPDIDSAESASAYLRKIKNILQYCNISDGKLEDGSMRADINLSIRPIGANWLGKRVEIKNINSISNAEKAIKFEANRLWEKIIQGESFPIETRRFDDQNNSTIFLREKNTNIDYCYIPECNITPIFLGNDFILNCKKEKMDVDDILNKLYDSFEDKRIAEHLFNNYHLYKIYENINSIINMPKEVYRWLLLEWFPLFSCEELFLKEMNNHLTEQIIELIIILKNEEINQKQAKQLLKLLYENKKKSIRKLISENNLIQINDPIIIKDLLKKIIDKNPNMMNNISDRPDRVKKFYIGILMKETNGQTNPNVASDIFNNFIKNK